MGLTHIAIYKGKATHLLTASATPTDRENAEFLYDGEKGKLEDGEWYYDTDTNTLLIYVGATWSMINFTSTP